MRCTPRPLAALLALCLLPASAAAQSYSSVELSRYDAPNALPGWRGEVALAGANALLSGAITGLVRELRGGSFRDGAVAGSSGGLVAYAGRRVSVLEFTSAGLLGRELGALGASMVRNGVAGEPLLSMIVLPMGPARVYIDRRRPGHTHLRLKLSAHDTYWLTRAVLDPELELRWGASLGAGAPVFQKTEGRLVLGGEELNGYQVGGAIFLSAEPGVGQHWTLAHERVHVLQSDYLSIAWYDPAEAWLMQQSGVTRALHRVFDVGLLDTALRTALTRGLRLRLLNGMLEFEAELLESR